MIDEPRARELANAAFAPGEVVLGEARELEQGWYFPGITKETRAVDSVIVNKESGEVLRLLIQGALSRDPSLYDRGYQFSRCDIVVFAVHDVDESVRTLFEVGERIVDTYYKFDKVWRVGRKLTEAEVRERLSSLPAVFTTGPLDFAADHLESARAAGWMDFKVLEYRGRD